MGLSRIISYANMIKSDMLSSAMKGIGFRVLAGGDSYNDVSMLKEADAGFFFCPPDSIVQEFPQFPVARSYAEFQEHLSRAGGFPS